MQATKTTLKQTPGKLYKWGWLGLIPNIGFVAGIIFLWKGIFQYKDRKLVLIGSACILFTFLFWSVVNHFIETSSTGKEMQYKLVRDQLNTLVKHIEFYKLHNGRYPDSLSQAVQEGDFVFIHDPIQSGMGRSKAEPLNYHKKDDTYYLFSSGYDKVPNTEDDIYPDMNKFDTLKFGLRIEKR